MTITSHPPHPFNITPELASRLITEQFPELTYPLLQLKSKAMIIAPIGSGMSYLFVCQLLNPTH